MNKATETPIFQFGTSRFLQAHADLFVDEALKRGEAVGKISVVKTTGDSSRVARLEGLTQVDGYPVCIKGLQAGVPIDSEQRIQSVARTFTTAQNWDALIACFVSEAQYVISNTGDRGFAAQPADGGNTFDQAMSYPAKLELLLRARFEASARPLTVMPMELIVKNGAILKARVLELASGQSPQYLEWLTSDVLWMDSLVDRIVSEPLEPAGAVAEPYALWAIEYQAGFVAPCVHPCIDIVDDLETPEALKLFILNLGHTYLADNWRAEETPPAYVREYLDNATVLADLNDLYEAEVIPAFTAAGIEEKARAYVETTIDRFRNPFLDHKIADIAGNHAEKIQRRIADFLAWAHKNGDTSMKPRLENIVQKAKEES
ncbi:D-mannonate oxidoreductase [Falsihalocynthiibacter arcticus]|uniref:D-mannonate oxidoreductase n=1 Tax=Falsihalocynthiibacter arcticus TaxID=1579316 RepID=A0A126V116_9RHOB|nr:D-mannonate oxidoreductase [Falsihalocynthiibacter arcticus]AML51389.1 D-mannonate oxidoreductase [Falsihalocynthiibacter arcticus]